MFCGALVRLVQRQRGAVFATHRDPCNAGINRDIRVPADHQ